VSAKARPTLRSVRGTAKHPRRAAPRTWLHARMPNADAVLGMAMNVGLSAGVLAPDLSRATSDLALWALGFQTLLTVGALPALGGRPAALRGARLLGVHLVTITLFLAAAAAGLGLETPLGFGMFVLAAVPPAGTWRRPHSQPDDFARHALPTRGRGRGGVGSHPGHRMPGRPPEAIGSSARGHASGRIQERSDGCRRFGTDGLRRSDTLPAVLSGRGAVLRSSRGGRKGRAHLGRRALLGIWNNWDSRPPRRPPVALRGAQGAGAPPTRPRTARP
jgi:hypothetical protein